MSPSGHGVKEVAKGNFGKSLISFLSTVKRAFDLSYLMLKNFFPY
jgi:hypothetical protein